MWKWKPFKIEFGDLLERVRYRFDLIEKEANAAEMEESSQFRDEGRTEIAAAEEERQKQSERWDTIEQHQKKVDDALDGMFQSFENRLVKSKEYR